LNIANILQYQIEANVQIGIQSLFNIGVSSFYRTMVVFLHHCTHSFVCLPSGSILFKLGKPTGSVPWLLGLIVVM
jgi:hypothetical protein